MVSKRRIQLKAELIEEQTDLGEFLVKNLTSSSFSICELIHIIMVN